MAHFHPFGSTAADLKAAIALSKRDEVSKAFAADDVAAAVALSKEEEEFGFMLDILSSIFRQSAFLEYIDKHCVLFEDKEDNKLECTQIHIGYRQLLDELLTAAFADLKVTPTEFETFCSQSLQFVRDVPRSIKDWLLSADEFTLFKRIMIDRKCELHHTNGTQTSEHIVQADSSFKGPNGICDEALAVVTAPTDARAETRSDGMAIPNGDPEVRPRTFLGTPQAASRQDHDVNMMLSTTVDETRTMKNSNQFFLYSKPNKVDGSLLAFEPADFAIRPEPWLLGKGMPATAPCFEQEGLALEKRSGPTEEELKQRAEYWRRQRELLRKSRAVGSAIQSDRRCHPKGRHVNDVEPASELRCSMDGQTKQENIPPVNVTAARLAITRQLRATFEGLKN